MKEKSSGKHPTETTQNLMVVCATLVLLATLMAGSTVDIEIIRVVCRTLLLIVAILFGFRVATRHFRLTPQDKD